MTILHIVVQAVIFNQVRERIGEERRRKGRISSVRLLREYYDHCRETHQFPAWIFFYVLTLLLSVGGWIAYFISL